MHVWAAMYNCTVVKLMMTYVCPQVPHNFIPLSILYGIVLYHKPSNIDGNWKYEDFHFRNIFCMLNMRINQYENSNQQPAIPHSGKFYSQIWQYLLGIQEQILI